MAHPGTYTNAPTLGVTGLVPGDSNTAVSFDPANDQYVVQDDSIGAQVFTALTLGCIIKPDDPTDANAPVFWGINGPLTDQIALQTDASGVLKFIAYGGAVPAFAVIGGTVMSSGSTYRVIATWDGTTAELFVDGVSDGTAAYAGVVDLQGSCQFYFATDSFNTSGNASFNGTGDEAFFVANHAATTGEIAAIDAAMNGTGDVETAINAVSPYIYWRFGEASGTVAEDSAVGNLYTPPIAYDMGPILPSTQGLQRLLFRHYSPHGRFETVWKLATDPITYSLTQPYPLITPEDVNQGNTPIGQQYMDATYLHVYYGPELVDADEAARLVASGIGTVT